MAAKKRGGRINNDVFDIANIKPLTDNQRKAFDSEKNLVLCGAAGSGKSFLACYFAVSELSTYNYTNIVIVRSAVPSRDIGFLPGTDKEKIRIYEEPYYGIFSELLGRGDAYEVLKAKNVLNFATTSYLRGVTFRNSFIILDECQNLEFKELDTLITRLGDNCRIVICGDFRQTDLRKNGMQKFLKVIDKMPEDFDVVEFTTEDIVRSGLVARYLKTVEAMNEDFFS